MTERAVQASGASESREYTQHDPLRPAVIPNRLQCSFLMFPAAAIPSAARLPSRIHRGFLEREANVKQTHRFR
jgi:hypothetical protein